MDVFAAGADEEPSCDETCLTGAESEGGIADGVA